MNVNEAISIRSLPSYAAGFPTLYTRSSAKQNRTTIHQLHKPINFLPASKKLQSPNTDAKKTSAAGEVPFAKSRCYPPCTKNPIRPCHFDKAICNLPYSRKLIIRIVSTPERQFWVRLDTLGVISVRYYTSSPSVQH